MKKLSPARLTEVFVLLALSIVLAVFWWRVSGEKLLSRPSKPGLSDIVITLNSACALPGSIDSTEGNLLDQLVIHTNGGGYLRVQKECDKDDPASPATTRTYSARFFNRDKLGQDLSAYPGVGAIAGYTTAPQQIISGRLTACDGSSIDSNASTLALSTNGQTSPDIACYLGVIDHSNMSRTVPDAGRIASASATIANDAAVALRKAYAP